MKKRTRNFILRGLVLYFALLCLSKTPWMFDPGFDPTNVFHILVVAMLIFYRFFVFALLPAFAVGALINHLSSLFIKE
ncbi:MAG: hypothetical protein WAX79_05245 [Candidatus Omnitrophota bacterium]